jgi:hypothetical protein
VAIGRVSAALNRLASMRNPEKRNPENSLPEKVVFSKQSEPNVGKLRILNLRLSRICCSGLRS